MTRRKYLYSFLSLLIVVLWVIVILKVIIDHADELDFAGIGIALALSIHLSIICAIIIILIRFLKRPNLRNSFGYNFLGTCNLFHSIVGFIQVGTQTPSPYFITAGFAIGILMYYDIYRERRNPWLLTKEKQE